MEGFNCPAERFCIPFSYLCDGVPDCGTVITPAVDESSQQCSGQYITILDPSCNKYCYLIGQKQVSISHINL